MIAAGTTGADGARSWRVITAVVALYALVLQAVLGGVAALPTLKVHDVLCRPLADGVGTSKPAQPQAPHQHHGDCCTAAVIADATAPALAVATIVAWPVLSTGRIFPRKDRAVSARAPPGLVASPRAPPVL